MAATFEGCFAAAEIELEDVCVLDSRNADDAAEAVEVCQQVTQVHRREKGVFGRYMPAGEQDYAALRDKLSSASARAV